MQRYLHILKAAQSKLIDPSKWRWALDLLLLWPDQAILVPVLVALDDPSCIMVHPPFPPQISECWSCVWPYIVLDCLPEITHILGPPLRQPLQQLMWMFAHSFKGDRPPFHLSFIPSYTDGWPMHQLFVFSLSKLLLACLLKTCSVRSVV